MNRFLLIFVAAAFLVRGFMGDAMAVAMAHDTMNMQVHADMPGTQTMAASCEEMMKHDDSTQDKNSPSKAHPHCQWCCAAITVSSTIRLDIPQASASSPAGVTLGFYSAEALLSFKPPIL